MSIHVKKAVLKNKKRLCVYHQRPEDTPTHLNLGVSKRIPLEEKDLYNDFIVFHVYVEVIDSMTNIFLVFNWSV